MGSNNEISVNIDNGNENGDSNSLGVEVIDNNSERLVSK